MLALVALALAAAAQADPYLPPAGKVWQGGIGTRFDVGQLCHPSGRLN
jgi:hypothetical protein